VTKQRTLTEQFMGECILLGGEAMTRRQAVELLTKEGCSRRCIDITVFGPRATAVQEQEYGSKATGGA
jgi:hypothetical protein